MYCSIASSDQSLIIKRDLKTDLPALLELYTLLKFETPAFRILNEDMQEFQHNNEGNVSTLLCIEF